MIRTRTFRWATMMPLDPGWIPDNAGKGWYPGAGFLTAHDLMEHLSNKADWAHELRAAGVSAFDVSGVKHRDMGSIAEDIVNFAAKDHLFDAPVAPARWNKPLAAKHERRVQHLAREMREIVENGLTKLANDPDAKRLAPRAALENAPHFVDKALPWVRLGYAAALRIYGDRGSEVGALMDRVRDAVNADHDRVRPVKGDTITLSVDTKALTFTLKRAGNESMSASQRNDRALRERIDTMFAGLFGAIA